MVIGTETHTGEKKMTHTVRITGNGHEFNIFVKAATADAAVTRTEASVATAKKYAKLSAASDLNVCVI